MILDPGLPPHHDGVRSAGVDKYVGLRRLKARQVVPEEAGIPRDPLLTNSGLAGYGGCDLSCLFTWALGGARYFLGGGFI